VPVPSGHAKARRGLLILHPGALGDVVATFPALLELRRRFRPLALLCQGHIAALASRLGVIDAPLDLESSVFGALFGAPSDPRLAGLLGPYRRVLVFSTRPRLADDLRRCLPDTALHPVTARPPLDRKTHVLQHLYDQLVACGLLAPADRPAPAAGPFGPANRKPSPPGGPILLHPGAGSPRKRWPLASFLTVAAGLEARGLQPAFLLGPAERDLAAGLQVPPKRPLHQVADLRRLQRLLAASGGLIGNDSGISHLSAFLGLPTVAVFGPSDARRWAPSGPVAAILQPGLDCRGCFEITPENCADPACLNGTRPAAVLKAFLTLYHRGFGKKSGDDEDLAPPQGSSGQRFQEGFAAE
jgi:ADP-heptose:LPS heptosyltransferase